jgi:hypothetical protein
MVGSVPEPEIDERWIHLVSSLNGAQGSIHEHLS